MNIDCPFIQTINQFTVGVNETRNRKGISKGEVAMKRRWDPPNCSIKQWRNIAGERSKRREYEKGKMERGLEWVTHHFLGAGMQTIWLNVFQNGKINLHRVRVQTRNDSKSKVIPMLRSSWNIYICWHGDTVAHEGGLGFSMANGSWLWLLFCRYKT